MRDKLAFYIRHSLNDLRVNPQRTIFALLCIAAGVAAIVGLQTLGVMIDDSLTGSLQESNRGDIRISVPVGGDVSDEAIERGRREGVIAEGRAFNNDYFSLAGVGVIQNWFASNAPGSEITYRQSVNSATAAISISVPDRDTEKPFVMPFIVDGQAYPLYGERRTEDGQRLSTVLTGPNDIVLARNLANDLDAAVGDTIRLSGAREDFVVRGILPTDAESGYENIFGALFGYYFIDISAVDLFDGLKPGANEIYVRLAEPDQVEAINERFEDRFPYVESTTTVELEEQNSEVSQTVNQMVIIMGLVSLLIGGIGIVNTMLVIVSRRTTEVAVLKTIGLEAEQVTALFLVEAVLMGIFGSILGIVLGWVAALAIKGVAEGFLAQSLSFRITLTPPLVGFIVGVLVTTIFGFLPTLAAGQVRPNLVLRPTDTIVPRAGRSRSFAALLFVMLAISLVVQPWINELLGEQTIRTAAMGVGGLLGVLMALTLLAGGIFSGWTQRQWWRRILRWLVFLLGLPVLGALFGYGVPALLILFNTFIIAGILYVILWVIIWLVGRFFPAWRSVDLRLALRSMLATKGRNASTLLALVIGVFTLSLITMLASVISNRFEQILIDEVGGNVIIFAQGAEDTQERIDAVLDRTEGVNSYSSLAIYDVELVSYKDSRTGEVLTADQLRRRVAGEKRYSEQLRWGLGGIDARGVDSNLPDVKFYDGRQLGPQDTGPWDPEQGQHPPIVISAFDGTVKAGIKVGDLLFFRLVPNTEGPVGSGSQEEIIIAFEVVGMTDRTGAQTATNFGSPNYAPMTAFPADMPPSTISAIVDIDEAHVRDLRRAMNEVPGVFVLETRMLNDLINRLIDQFTSFPILVAGLALIVGGIVIANSVALSTLERRREIAIMKAVGLQRERVLGMILLEYGLMGLIGGLIGVGLGGIGLLILLIQVFGGNLGRSIPYFTAFELMALCVVIALLAAVMTAWRASGEKPLNVLRYE